MDVIECSVYQMAEIWNTKSSTYPAYTESSKKGINAVTQKISVTQISVDIYYVLYHWLVSTIMIYNLNVLQRKHMAPIFALVLY
jgi:hypothetical protein